MDIEEQDQISRAMNRAYFYLKFRPRTEKEVRDYLLKKSEKFYHWPPHIIEAAISRLKENNYINDKNFIDAFVHQRTSVKPKGEYALSQELQKYGVNRDSINEYFQENPVEEEKLALDALMRRWSRFQYLDKQERFQKAAAFLSRRGFGFDVIKNAISEMEGL